MNHISMKTEGTTDLVATVFVDSPTEQVEYIEQVRGTDKPFIRVMERRQAYGLLFNEMMKLTLARQAFTYDEDKGLVYEDNGYTVHAFICGI